MTKARIPPLADDCEDPAAAEALAAIGRTWGEPWNVARVMAHAPDVLAAFNAYWRGLRKTGLDDLDREVVDLSMAYLNDCHYCVPAHVKLARETGLAEADIRAILAGAPVGTERGRLIQDLTRALLQRKGRLTDAEFAAFEARGADPRTMIEVIAEIAHCTLTNYVNRLAGTPLDAFLDDVKT